MRYGVHSLKHDAENNTVVTYVAIKYFPSVSAPYLFAKLVYGLLLLLRRIQSDVTELN